MQKVLTTQELAERWDVKRSTITAMVEKGQLKAVIDNGMGSRRRFAVSYIEEIERLGGFAETECSVLKVKELQKELERVRADNQRLRAAMDSFIALAIAERSKASENR